MWVSVCLYVLASVFTFLCVSNKTILSKWILIKYFQLKFQSAKDRPFCVMYTHKILGFHSRLSSCRGPAVLLWYIWPCGCSTSVLSKSNQFLNLFCSQFISHFFVWFTSGKCIYTVDFLWQFSRTFLTNTLMEICNCAVIKCWI
jgi:hypothetical protein